MRGPVRRGVTILLLLLGGLFAASFLAGRLGVFSGTTFPLTQEKVAVLHVTGVLEDAAAFLEEFETFKERGDVKAIVVRIESPGGTIVPAQEIFEEIWKLRGSKPVVASLGNVAASGGYYVACAAEEIVANRGSITGSIGVITVFQNYRELLDKVGWKTQVMKSGQYKDLGDPTRDMTPEEMRIEQQVLDNIHQQFIHDVALGRDRKVEEIVPLADGRMFTGEQALQAGLVDRLGNLQDTIDRAAELGGIRGKPTVIYPEAKRSGILDFVFQEFQSRLRWQWPDLWSRLRPVLLHAPFLP